MRFPTWALAALLAATALAGCLGQPPPAEQKGQGTASSVTVTRAPTEAPANSQALVCWRVDGSGNVPHTAVHYDTTSHPTATSFTEYAGGAVYPGNQSAQDPDGYDLPGDFCGNVPVGNQDVYYRAHVIDKAGAPGMLDDERKVTARQAGAVIVAVTTRDAPASAPANASLTVCWDVQGTGRVPHVAVHTDGVSHRTSVNFEDYKGATYYPNNRTTPDPAGYQLPGGFCTNVTMPANGTLYVRGHAMNTPPGVLSANEEEIRVEGAAMQPGVAATVLFLGQPTPSAPRGSNLTVCWRVSGTGHVPHTAVHTDNQSHAADPVAEFDAYAGQAYYPGNRTEVDPAGYDLPGDFCTNLPVPSTMGQTVYYRAHVIDSRPGKGTLSPDERSVTAT